MKLISLCPAQITNRQYYVFVAAMSAKLEIISKFKSTFHCGRARDCDGAGASFPRSSDPVSGSVLFLV